MFILIGKKLLVGIPIFHYVVLLPTFEHSDAHFVAIGQFLQRAHHYGIHDVRSFLTGNLKEISQSQHFHDF